MLVFHLRATSPDETYARLPRIGLFALGKTMEKFLFTHISVILAYSNYNRVQRTNMRAFGEVVAAYLSTTFRYLSR